MCASRSTATASSVPIYDLAISIVNEESAEPKYYPCCGTSICIGCIHSIVKSENNYKCPFCNSDRVGKTDEEMVEEMRKRVEANDPVSICLLANFITEVDVCNRIRQDHTPEKLNCQLKE